MTKKEQDTLPQENLPALAETDLKVLDIAEMTPAPPAEATEEELARALEKASALAGDILARPDDRDAVRSVAMAGEKIQARANSEFSLLRTSLGQVIDRMNRDEQGGVAADLRSLREIMDRINPYPVIEQIKQARTAGWLSRTLRRLPTVGRLLADIAQRYESVQTQIEAIIQALYAGSDRLLENSIEIDERYKALKELQRQVQFQAYRMELVWSELEQAREQTQEPEKQRLLQRAIVRIARRAQNLRVTEQAFAQMFVTMNTTMDNHENLRDAIQAMVNLTRPVLENGLALKIAQQEERAIAEALEASQDYLGSLMTSIAQDSMDNAALVAEVANKPLVKFKDLVTAYHTLVSRMEEASEIESQMLLNAKQNIDQLQDMSARLEELAQAQEGARESINAADLE